MSGDPGMTGRSAISPELFRSWSRASRIVVAAAHRKRARWCLRFLRTGTRPFSPGREELKANAACLGSSLQMLKASSATMPMPMMSTASATGS
jgi:hypothetical protein